MRSHAPDAPDATVVGSGPNGLAAAIALAQAGRSVRVIEGADRIGGGLRTAQVTVPGLVHDLFSAVHPLGVASPFLGRLPLEQHGLAWIEPPIALAHPFDDGTASILTRDLDATVDAFGADGDAYRALVHGIVDRWADLTRDALGPLHIPRHPFLLASFGLKGLRSVEGLVRARFTTPGARAIIAGIGAHAVQPLDTLSTAAIALVLASAAHRVGWPIPRGGSHAIADAMRSYLESLGGEIVTGNRITSFRELPASRAILFDLTPRQLLALADAPWPARYRRALERFRYGPGVFKVDWALSEPVPWRAEACRRAGTVHVGGTLEEIAQSEREMPLRPPARPYTLIAQPTVFDPSRSAHGEHALWGYCHVPHGSTHDMTEAIEAQIERFAPGFRDVIIARHTIDTAGFERLNPNIVGGDIGGGATDLPQLFFRPTMRWDPHRTPVRGVYICSSSTPPGGGVHGLCGYHAARSALRHEFGAATNPR